MRPQLKLSKTSLGNALAVAVFAATLALFLWSLVDVFGALNNFLPASQRELVLVDAYTCRVS